jgi:tol-pal system protein YbgF
MYEKVFLVIKRQVLLLLYIFMLLLMNGCVSTLAQKNMEQDLITLKEKVESLEKNYEIQLNKTIEDAVSKVDATYKNSMEVALKNQASISSDLETIRIDFRRVKGDVEEVAHKAEKYLTEDRGKIADYDLRLRELELEVAKVKGKLETLENNQKLFTTIFSSKAKTPPPTATTPLTSVIPDTGLEGTDTAAEVPTTEGADASTAEEATTPVVTEEATPAAEAGVSVAAVPDSTGTTPDTTTPAVTDTGAEEVEKKIPEEAIKAYEEAYEVFKAERFDEARKMFADFSSKYPDTQLTDNAQYWVAECYYKKKEFDKAILEYDKMVANYPESDKVPSALLKEGFSFLQLEYKDEAIIKLKKLIADFPDTNQAEIARRKLKVIE